VQWPTQFGSSWTTPFPRFKTAKPAACDAAPAAVPQAQVINKIKTILRNLQMSKWNIVPLSPGYGGGGKKPSATWTGIEVVFLINCLVLSQLRSHGSLPEAVSLLGLVLITRHFAIARKCKIGSFRRGSVQAQCGWYGSFYTVAAGKWLWRCNNPLLVDEAAQGTNITMYCLDLNRHVLILNGDDFRAWYNTHQLKFGQCNFAWNRPIWVSLYSLW